MKDGALSLWGQFSSYRLLGVNQKYESNNPEHQEATSFLRAEKGCCWLLKTWRAPSLKFLIWAVPTCTRLMFWISSILMDLFSGPFWLHQVLWLHNRHCFCLKIPYPWDFDLQNLIFGELFHQNHYCYQMHLPQLLWNVAAHLHLAALLFQIQALKRLLWQSYLTWHIFPPVRSVLYEDFFLYLKISAAHFLPPLSW